MKHGSRNGCEAEVQQFTYPKSVNGSAAQGEWE